MVNINVTEIFAAWLFLIPFFKCRYATEVDVDFVRKSVRAIGRCAIKVEVSSASEMDLLQ